MLVPKGRYLTRHIIGSAIYLVYISSDAHFPSIQFINLLTAKRIFDAKTKNRKRSSLNKRESNIALAKVHKNLPMLTGRIKWLKELEYRVKKPYEEFQNTNSA